MKTDCKCGEELTVHGLVVNETCTNLTAIFYCQKCGERISDFYSIDFMYSQQEKIKPFIQE